MPDEQRRCYVTVLYGFDAYSDEDERCKREGIHLAAAATAQQYGTFINHWEMHDENILAETDERIDTPKKSGWHRVAS